MNFEMTNRTVSHLRRAPAQFALSLTRPIAFGFCEIRLVGVGRGLGPGLLGRRVWDEDQDRITCVLGTRQ